jgi:hypothetical protein
MFPSLQNVKNIENSNKPFAGPSLSSTISAQKPREQFLAAAGAALSIRS